MLRQAVCTSRRRNSGCPSIGNRDVQPTFDLATGVWGNSFFFYDTRRPAKTARVDANSYIPGGDVDHELKYGFSWRSQETNSIFGVAAGSVAIFFEGSPFAAELRHDAVDNYKGTRTSFYVGDTISTDRLTIKAGLRYDRQDSESLPSGVPASRFAPELLPAQRFEGATTPFAWVGLSPRLGLTYRLGDGKTILRATAGRYYAQQFNGEFHLRNTTFGPFMRFFWTDPNGNGAFDPGELASPNPWFVSAGFDPENPNAPQREITINETRPPITDQLVLGIEHEVLRNLGIGASFGYGRNHRENWVIRDGEASPDAWTPVTETVELADGTTETVTWYHPVEARTNAEVYKERPGFSTSSMNLTAFLEKRFADGWLAKASFSWSDPSVNYDDPLSFTDPTNIPFQDGRPGHDRLSATWMVKGSGMYQLPAGFSVAGFFQVREGYIFNPTVLVPSRPNGGGSIQVLTVPKGEDRLPTFWNLDLRVEKTLDILDRGRLHLILDGFNLPNNDIVLGRSSTLNTSVFNRITEVVQGRTIRFGVRLVLR